MDNINWFLWKCSIWHLSLTIIAEQTVTLWKARRREERECGKWRERERTVCQYWSRKLLSPTWNVVMKTDQGQCSDYLTRFWQQLRDCHAPGPYFSFVLATVRHLAKQTRNAANVVAKAFSRLPFSLWIIRFQRGLHFVFVSPITVTDMWPRHTHTPLADLTSCLAKFERVVQ